MELMSMLLSCAFVVSLPLALGTYGAYDSRMNSSNFIENSTFTNKSHRVIDINLVPIDQIHVNAALKALFLDSRCKHCHSCIERALTVQKNCTQRNRQPKEFFYDIFEENFKHLRNKRNINLNSNNTNYEMEKSKPNNIIVTKYKSGDDKVYAIKVNETNDHISETNPKSTCKVYSVKKAYTCESDESHLILTKQKVRSNKKSRLSKEKAVTTEKAKSITPVFQKRKVRVESSNLPESFMPSLEDLY